MKWITLATFTVVTACAQTAPSFEVVSIKPNTSDGQRMMLNMEPSGNFRGVGIPIKLVLEQAYDLKDSQVIGAPAWLGTDKFDIEAKPDEATVEEMKKLSDDERLKKFSAMMQALLTDRCKLVARKETRELPIYSLIATKNGIKFHESGSQPSADPSAIRGGVRMGRGQLDGNSVPISTLANVLSRQLGRPVTDNTGLKGNFDFSLKWTPDDNQGQMRPPTGDTPPPATMAGPSIFTAVQEQLGLKLEPQKSAMAVIVIDHIEKPSAN